MKNILFTISVFLVVLGLNAFQVNANQYQVVTISNDENNNELLIYDSNGKMMQSIPTQGKGGVPPHITGGAVAKSDTLLAVINYNSQSVTLFQRQGNSFNVSQVIKTKSKPVSLAFGGDHLYVLGTNTIESFMMDNDTVSETADGSANLLVNDGTGAQVGVLSNQLIISERSSMIELADLQNGVVTSTITPVQLPPPPGNDTPVGLVTRGDTAYVTIAHSDAVGIVRNGKLIRVISSEGQHAPCWLTLQGSWLFCSNTPSKSITRYKVSDTSIAIEQLIAIKTSGEPTDIDADSGIMAAIELTPNGTNISQFQIDSSGNLKLLNSSPAGKNANGVAVLKMSTQTTQPQNGSSQTPRTNFRQ